MGGAIMSNNSYTQKSMEAMQLAQRIAHKLVLDEVKRKVHMMTGGRPLNRY